MLWPYPSMIYDLISTSDGFSRTQAIPARPSRPMLGPDVDTARTCQDWFLFANMQKKIAFQMDPIEHVDIEGDSTFKLAFEAQNRGHDIY